MVARHAQARKRLLTEKVLSAGKNVRDYCADFTTFAARISASIVCTWGEIAICLARQAGPGPRI
jgi:hypothetical protein